MKEEDILEGFELVEVSDQVKDTNDILDGFELVEEPEVKEPEVEEKELASEDISSDVLDEDRLKNIKSAFDQGEFKIAEKEAFENYKETGELDVSLLPDESLNPEKSLLIDYGSRLGTTVINLVKGKEDIETGFKMLGAKYAMDLFNSEATKEEKAAAIQTIKLMGDAETAGLSEGLNAFSKNLRVYETESMIDDFNNKNYGQFTERVIGQTIGAIPSIALSLTGIGGLISMGTSSAGNKFSELIEENPEESLERVMFNSLGTGTIEAVFELGTRGILKKAGLLEGAGAKKAASDLIQSYTSKFAKYLGIPGEGFLEAGTVGTQDLLDALPRNLGGLGKAEQYENMSDYFEAKGTVKKMWEAFSVGTAMGGGVALAGSIKSNKPAERDRAEHMLTPESDKKTIEKSAEQINILSKGIKTATEDQVSMIEDQIAKEEQVIINTRKKVSEELNLMKTEELKSYAKGIDEITKMKSNLKSKNPFIVKKSQEQIQEAEENNTKLIRESVNRRLKENIETITKEAEKIGKTVNSFKTAEEYQKAYDNTDIGQKNSMNVQSSDGFFDPNGDIYINEEVAKKVMSVNVGAHELLHGILKNSFKEPGQLKRVVNDFKSILPSDQAAMIQKRIDDNYRYEKFDSKSKITIAEQDIKNIEENEDGSVVVELNEELYNEEYLTAFADLIGNKKIKFNENIFTRIGDFISPMFRSKGYDHIRFDSGKDVYNFIKDYQKQIEKGELKPEVVELAKKGVEGDLMFSKSEVTDLAKQYKADPAKTDVEQLVKQYNNVALKALGYDISKGTIAPEEAISFVNKEFDSILRRYDGSTEFSTWVNSNIRPKQQAFYEEQIGKQSETTSIDSEQARQVVDDSETTTDDRTEKEIRQAERKTKVAKRLKLEDKAVKEVSEKVKDIDLSKVNYKTLKNLANETIGDAFGISPKKILNNANLTKGEIASAQRYIKNNVDLLKALLPDGYNKDFKSTGVPKVLLDKFYNKRSVRAKTGAGLNVQTKKPNIGSTEFLEVFGFVEGKPTRDDRNISARIIALANQTGKAITNQTVREQLQKEGMPESALQDIKSGTPVGMFSKSKDAKIEKPKGVKEKIKSIIEKADVKPLEVKGDGRIESIEYLTNDFFPTLINEFGDAARFLLKSSTISPSGNEAISKNKDGSIKKTGGAIGRDQLFITDIAKTIRSKPETQKLLDEKKLGQLKDVLSLLKVDLKKNNNLENIKTATLPQKTPNIKRNLNTREQHKEGSKAIINSLKKMHDADKKSLSGIAFLLYNANANSSFYRNLAQLIGVEQGSGKNNAREEHMFQAGPWAERTLEAITKPKKIFDAYNSWQADNYYQETITKDSERLVDGKYKLDDGAFWSAKFQEHPYMKEQMDIAMKTGDFSKVPSPDIRKYNEFYGLNPNSIIRENFSDAKRYNVEVPKKLQNQNTKAFQVKLIFEQITGKIDSKTAKKQLDQYLKIAPSQLKASESTNKTLSDSKVLNVDKNLNIQDLLGKAAAIDDALSIARDVNAPVKKIRVFDFDDTLATTKSDVLFTAPDGTEGKLNAEEFAIKGKELLDDGYVFDFSEFNKVTKGKPGPLLDIAKKIQAARGTEDVFVLTARAAEAQLAIKEFLDSVGLNIPLKNITGLGNSTGEAKANWMVDKAAEGYNDFYFADDAYQNVKAVRDVMSVVDVKSKVQQAKFSKSKNISSDFNKLIEESTGIGAEKVFSNVKAQVRGAKARRQRFFIPPSAEDMLGLVYTTLGKGKKGEAHLKFYQENLFDPYTKAMENLSTDRVNLMSDFKALKKELNVPKDLAKKTESGFTNEQATRVYLWNKIGEKIPGLSNTDLKELNDIVENNPNLKVFADQILSITKGDGYSKPKENWAVGTITTDLIDILNTKKRSKYLETWKQNRDLIYSKENLNKLEAAYGPKYRAAIENSLRRMESGSNRLSGGNQLSNKVLDYINNSTGAIMFFNTRSAILQTISAANFINWGFNNPLKAGMAFANQPQYWKDFVELINSDYLKDRRNGLKLNINESEIANAAKTSGNKAKAGLNYILEKGYAPTKFADSFAIASGGATFYRNRINNLIKNEGKTEAEAKKIAMKEFRQVSEISQQSSDPSKISQQQSSDLGRMVLQFANTPMQYARIQKRAVQDIVNRRGDLKTNISKIAYYGFLQNMLFNALQQGIFALGFGDDEIDEKEEGKLIKSANGMLDSLLRGLGMAGVTVQVLKNLGIDIYDRSKKDRPEYSDSYKKLLDFSPAVKSKLGKFQSAAYPFDSKKRRTEVFEKGFSLDNPAYESMAKVVTGTTNVPLDRMYSKVNNLSAAMDQETETWQSVAMVLGWPEWQIKGKKSDEDEKKVVSKEQTKKDLEKKLGVKFL